MRALALGLAAVLTLGVTSRDLAAQEREEILSYDVTVDVQDGSRMVVTEEITVRVACGPAGEAAAGSPGAVRT